MATYSKKVVVAGGRELRFAALTFRQLDEHKDAIDLLMSAKGANFASADARHAVVEVARASLHGASPEVSEAFLMDNLDTVNFTDVITAIFDRNGFIAKEGDAGEAVAAPSPI